MKKISSNQKFFIFQNHFQLDNSYDFTKTIFHECQRSRKFEYLHSIFAYSMSDNAVYCVDCALFLSAEKQRSFGSYINEGKRVAITFQENQRLNLGNQHHKTDAQVSTGIKENFKNHSLFLISFFNKLTKL